MVNPKVSVCVITYNQAREIGPCLDSILNQDTNFEFEVIVGEDCSTDGTRTVVEAYSRQYPHLFRPIYHSQNLGGGCNNYRATHRAAKGEYIAHIDGDDLMHPRKLQMQAEFLDEHPECSMVVHKAVYLDKSTGKTRIAPENDYPPTSTIYDLLKEHMFFVHSSKMYRKAANVTPSCIDESVFIDFELHVEHASTGMVGYINEALVTYQILPSSISRASGKRLSNLIDITHRGYSRAIELGADRRSIEHLSSLYLIRAALSCLESKDMECFNFCMGKIDASTVTTYPSSFVRKLRKFPKVRLMSFRVLLLLKKANPSFAKWFRRLHSSKGPREPNGR